MENCSAASAAKKESNPNFFGNALYKDDLFPEGQNKKHSLCLSGE
jgi:hypothetical protein